MAGPNSGRCSVLLISPFPRRKLPDPEVFRPVIHIVALAADIRRPTIVIVADLFHEKGDAQICAFVSHGPDPCCLHAACTDQGIRKVKDSSKRAAAFKDMAKKCGATVKDVFWTLGEYDIVAIVEAPDDISMTALGLSSGALGNIRTQTLRALAQEDMKTVVGKMVK